MVHKKPSCFKVIQKQRVALEGSGGGGAGVRVVVVEEEVVVVGDEI